MEQYTVTGMSCAACQANVEKAVSQVEGVKSCSVSLLTNSMGVEGNASSAAVIRAVEQAGYGAALKSAPAAKTTALEAEEDALKDRETPKLKKRLLLSLGFLIALMYVSMGHNMLHLPVPGLLEHNHLGLTLVQMLLALIVMMINGKFFTSGFRSLMHGSPNMDTLVALGSAVSFLWSLAVFFRMTVLITNGASNMELMPLYHSELYFESAAMIPALITVGKMLEAMSKGRTTDALKGLMKLAPKTAVVVRDGVETEVGIEEVVKGDLFAVRAGERIPVDGIIREGAASVNESALTGESIPVDKTVGDPVSAATINESGYIRCEATRVGEDTTLSQIIRMVSDAAATKAPIARIADKVSAVFVPAVIGIALVTVIGWLLAGQSFAFALARGISVLVISCPCALGLATPVAIMVGNGVGAKNGILFKNSESLENAGKVQIIALDKTGTITEGTPKVTDILPNGRTERELLETAYALEAKSEHPLSRAIIEKAKEEGLTPAEAADFLVLPGNGLQATIGHQIVHGGKAEFIATLCPVTPDLQNQINQLSDEGKTPLLFEADGALLGVIAVADVIRADSAEAIAELQRMGIEVVMLTGDNERTAQAIGRTAGVDEVIAGVLPDGKEEKIRQLMKRGMTAMTGDGINDAPALTRADIGIAVGAGTDVAIDSADIVLMNSSLKDVAAAVRLSRETLRNIHENLFWAFFYNAICIPLAAGLFPWKMNPMVGAAAMSLSSFTVCMNALRLNLFDLHNAANDRPMRRRAHSREEIEQTPETLTLSVRGMMCEHCEARVQNALLAVDGVTAAKADHKTGEVKVELNQPIDISVLQQAVQEAGYETADQQIKEEETNMKKILQVEGMMCEHCEATVKKALEAVDGVESAVADHNANTATVTLSKEVDDAVLRAAVEAKDYKVGEISA